MIEQKLPYISVIIIAYNRREFLLKAIKSVINQTLDKQYYEIIVIKNYNDGKIDDFINKNNIINIFSSDNSIVGKIDDAIKISNGDIISFLEDDDLFFENKLEIVYKEFKKDMNIVYYHNLCVPINKNGETINMNHINTRLDFNLSSISIKKSIVKIHNADQINGAPDSLMYLCALESDKKIIEGKEKLTYYMYHNSASVTACKNIEEYRKFVIRRSDLDLSYFMHFNNLFHSKKAINYINSQITECQISNYIFGSNEFPGKLINYIINHLGKFKVNAELILVCIVIRIYPNSRKYFINKLWNIYSKQFNEVI